MRPKPGTVPHRLAVAVTVDSPCLAPQDPANPFTGGGWVVLQGAGGLRGGILGRARDLPGPRRDRSANDTVPDAACTPPWKLFSTSPPKRPCLHGCLALRVERARRLVQDQHPGFGKHGTGKSYPLPLPPTEGRPSLAYLEPGEAGTRKEYRRTGRQGDRGAGRRKGATTKGLRCERRGQPYLRVAGGLVSPIGGSAGRSPSPPTRARLRACFCVAAAHRARGKR